MSDREKLIELIDSARYWGSNTSAEIADHLIANSVIVPPVRVGQKVWEINFNNIIIEQEILGVTIGRYVEDYGMDDDILLRVGYRCNAGGFTLHYLCLDDIGTDLFLTKEEAEKALAERMKEVK